MLEKFSFDPRIDIREVSDGGDITVIEHYEDGAEEEYTLPIETILDYLQRASTNIIESYDDTIVITVEKD